MLQRWESFFTDIIKGKRTGILPTVIRSILHVFSWFYQLIVACKNWAFDRGWMKRHYPPVPVTISIGNIVAGGTGKTPVTLMIAKEFYEEFPLAILSRGYRAPAEKRSSPLTLSQGTGPLYPATVSGDEPYLIAQNLPKAFVFVGKNRHQASHLAAQAGAQLILLDDAMQHRHVARDFDVVVINARDPFGQGYFLPRGFLRESVSSLSRANLIVLNHIHDHDHFLATKERIAKYTSSPVIGTHIQVADIIDFEGQSVGSIEGKKVGIFCSIAHPENFRNTVKELGAYVEAQYSKPDHVGYGPTELKHLAKSCKQQGIEMLLCTEKDKVRFEKSPQLSIPLAWVKVHLKITEGKAEWDKFIRKAKLDIKHRA